MAVYALGELVPATTPETIGGLLFWWKMRKRIIKPQFWDSEKVAKLPIGARLTFIGLWQMADRAGHVRYNPKRIETQLYPYDGPLPIADWVEQMQEQGLVSLWRCSIHDHLVLTINGFCEHQSIHPNETASIYES